MIALPPERRDTGTIVAILGVVVLVAGGLVLVATLAPAPDDPHATDDVRATPAPPGATAPERSERFGVGRDADPDAVSSQRLESQATDPNAAGNRGVAPDA